DDLLPHLPRLPTRRQPPNEGAGPSPRRSRRRRAQHVAGRSLTTAPLRAPWLSGGTAGADRVGGMNKRALLAGGLAASAAAAIRVLHVSDLHLAPWQKHRAAWVKALTRLDPDLVVNTGDNLSADIVPRVLDVFDELIDVPGVFVLGSNDFFSPQAKNPATY